MWSVPAAIAFRVAAAHVQWIPVRRFSRCASSTAARSSSTVYDGREEIVPTVPPPLPMILM